MTIVGVSEPLNQRLYDMVYSGQGQTQIEKVRVQFRGPEVNGQTVQIKEAEALCQTFMQTVCTVDVMVKPSSRIQHFMREKLGLGTDEGSMAQL